MTILVNATSCREGGALQIVQSFVDSYDCDEQVILLAPENIEVQSHKVDHVVLSTTRIYTLLFSLFGILLFVVKFRPRVLLSFTNINTIFPVCERIIYFHQLKIFTDKGLRFRLFRFLISSFLLNCKYIFQTSFVSDEFHKCFKRSVDSVVRWPGLSQPPSFNNCPNSKNKALIPYSSIDAPQKNFSFFHDNQQKLLTLCSSIKVVSNEKNQVNGFTFVGHKCRDSMNQLYDDVSILLVSSVVETLCLPIFEFACTGKPVLVLRAPYTDGLLSTVKLTKNIVFTEENDFFNKLEDIIVNYEFYCLADESEVEHYKKSNWKIF